MTDKKKKILDAALQLFAGEGFNATSTKKIAQHARVSEALIFRHFTSKEGLLRAVIDMGKERAKYLYADIVLETEPHVLLRKALDMPLRIIQDPKAFEFWKAQYKIMWETGEYFARTLEPLELALSNAFRKLGYESPESEAMHVLIIVDGLATRFILQKEFEIEPQLFLIRNKYNV